MLSEIPHEREITAKIHRAETARSTYTMLDEANWPVCTEKVNGINCVESITGVLRGQSWTWQYSLWLDTTSFFRWFERQNSACSSKRYFAIQITCRHLIAKSGALCGGQDYGTNSGLNGQFVVFYIPNKAPGLKRTKQNIFEFLVQKVQIWKFQNFGHKVLFWAVPWKWATFDQRCSYIIFIILEGLSGQVGLVLLWWNCSVVFRRLKFKIWFFWGFCIKMYC